MAAVDNLARSLRKIDEEIAALEAEYGPKMSDAKARQRTAEMALFEAMVDSNTSKTTIDNVPYAVDAKTHYSCLADRRDALYEALIPFGREGIFKTTFGVHPGTLESAMREWDEIDGGIPEPVLEILTVFDEGKVKRPKVKL